MLRYFQCAVVSPEVSGWGSAFTTSLKMPVANYNVLKIPPSTFGETTTHWKCPGIFKLVVNAPAPPGHLQNVGNKVSDVRIKEVSSLRLIEFSPNVTKIQWIKWIQGNLINHWSMNYCQFKDLFCYMCLPGAVVTYRFLTQEIAGSNILFTKIVYQFCRF